MRAIRKDTSSRRGTEPPLFWVSQPGARRVLIGLHLASILTVFFELLVPLSTDPHAVERVRSLDFPGSYAIYGLISCVLLVLLGLALRRLVMRDEGYYGNDS